MLNFVLPVLFSLTVQTQTSISVDHSIVLDASSSSSSSSQLVSSSLSNAFSAVDAGVTLASSSSFVAVVLPSPENTKPEDVFTLVSLLVNAVKNKNYTLAYGILLMIIVYALRVFVLPKISKSDAYIRWIPVISMLIASIPGIAAKFLSSGVSVEEVLTATFSIGMIAVGTWELAGKPINKVILSKNTTYASSASQEASVADTKKEG